MRSRRRPGALGKSPFQALRRLAAPTTLAARRPGVKPPVQTTAAPQRRRRLNTPYTAAAGLVRACRQSRRLDPPPPLPLSAPAAPRSTAHPPLPRDCFPAMPPAHPLHRRYCGRLCIYRPRPRRPPLPRVRLIAATPHFSQHCWATAPIPPLYRFLRKAGPPCPFPSSHENRLTSHEQQSLSKRMILIPNARPPRRRLNWRCGLEWEKGGLGEAAEAVIGNCLQL